MITARDFIPYSPGEKQFIVKSLLILLVYFNYNHYLIIIAIK